MSAEYKCHNRLNICLCAHSIRSKPHTHTQTHMRDTHALLCTHMRATRTPVCMKLSSGTYAHRRRCLSNALARDAPMHTHQRMLYRRECTHAHVPIYAYRCMLCSHANTPTRAHAPTTHSFPTHGRVLCSHANASTRSQHKHTHTHTHKHPLVTHGRRLRSHECKQTHARTHAIHDAPKQHTHSSHPDTNVVFLTLRHTGTLRGEAHPRRAGGGSSTIGTETETETGTEIGTETGVGIGAGPEAGVGRETGAGSEGGTATEMGVCVVTSFVYLLICLSELCVCLCVSARVVFA